MHVTINDRGFPTATVNTPKGQVVLTMFSGDHVQIAVPSRELGPFMTGNRGYYDVYGFLFHDGTSDWFGHGDSLRLERRDKPQSAGPVYVITRAERARVRMFLSPFVREFATEEVRLKGQLAHLQAQMRIETASLDEIELQREKIIGRRTELYAQILDVQTLLSDVGKGVSA